MKPLLRKGILCAGLMLAVFVSGSVSAQVLQRYHTGSWEIAANANSGSFQNCTASGRYGGGASVMFMLTRNMVWGVAVTNPNWNWRPGSRGSMNYWIDSGSVRRGAVSAPAQNRLIMPLADSTSLFNEIRGGQRMYFRPDGHSTFNMTLVGTSVALSELMACVRKYR